MEITREILEKLYIQEQKSCRESGLVLSKSPAEICRLLKRFDIKARPCTTKGKPAWNRGVPMTVTAKENLRKARKGYVLSPEHREKVIRTLSYGGRKERNNNWKGGKHYSSNGYVLLRLPNHPDALSNGYVPEHRYVMEQKIGRRLTKLEHVHHLNGIKDDNRPENLELLNGHTHNLVTMAEKRIKMLEAEIEELKKKPIIS